MFPTLEKTQIKRAWSYVKSHATGEGGVLDDSDLDAVSGGAMGYIGLLVEEMFEVARAAIFLSFKMEGLLTM